MTALDPEAEAFVRSHSRSFLLTRRASGAPTGHPMTLRVSPDGHLLFNAYRASAKVRNLVADPRVSCVVTSSPADVSPRWVVVHGTAEVLDQAAGIEAWSTSGGGPAVAINGARAVATVGATVEARLADGRRVIVRVRPTSCAGPFPFPERED